MLIEEINNIQTFEEFLKILTKDALQSILREYGSKVSGKKDELIKRVLQISTKIGSGGIIYSIPWYELEYLFEEEDIESAELRKLLESKFFPAKPSNIQMDVKTNLENFFESLKYKKRTEITISTFLEPELYKLEHLIYLLKEQYEVNQYLDNSIYSDSIEQSMCEKKEDIHFHYEYHYHFSIMYFLYENIKNGKLYNQLITLSKDFFKIDGVKKNLNFKDIKIHDTGGTRCISYLETSISFLRKLLVINPSKELDKNGNKRHIELTLFGYYLMKNLINEFPNYSNDDIYNHLFNNPLRNYNFIKNNYRPDVVDDFLYSLKELVEQDLLDVIREYIITYHLMLKNHIKIEMDKENNFTSVKLNDEESEKVLFEFWNKMKSNRDYHRIMDSIYNRQYYKNLLLFSESD